MSKKLIQLRKGTLCLLCDYNSHQYINFEGKFMSYSKKYCTYLKDNFLTVMDIKYNLVYKKLLYLAEWFYFVNGIEILSPESKLTLRKYLRSVNECK